jgi:integrase
VPRYDPARAGHRATLPYFFQRRRGYERGVISQGGSVWFLQLAIERANLTGPDGNPLNYTPHDFRRIFATEAVSSGLPIHIAQSCWATTI